MTVVYWARYPDSTTQSRSFENDEDAMRFYELKQIDYRGTVGEVWFKRYEE